MRELQTLVKMLRLIRDAERRFMRLWGLEEIFVGPEVLDRVAADLAGSKGCAGLSGRGAIPPGTPGR